jgi:hypothetical protein
LLRRLWEGFNGNRLEVIELVRGLKEFSRMKSRVSQIFLDFHLKILLGHSFGHSKSDKTLQLSLNLSRFSSIVNQRRRKTCRKHREIIHLTSRETRRDFGTIESRADDNFPSLLWRKSGKFIPFLLARCQKSTINFRSSIVESWKEAKVIGGEVAVA